MDMVNIDIDWESQTLIPVIAQSSTTKEVLMLAYMNKEAFDLTLSTGYAHYYSRSRSRIWKERGNLKSYSKGCRYSFGL